MVMLPTFQSNIIIITISTLFLSSSVNIDAVNLGSVIFFQYFVFQIM